MSRDSSLLTVRGMVKSHRGLSLATTSNQQDNEINQIIDDTQQWLASDYDWPFLRCRWDVNIPMGGRYTSFPTVDDVGLTANINFERAGDLRVYIKWNEVWQEVDYGINEEFEFNYIDSDRGQVLDPIQRWEFDDENKFEVWPLPATATTMRFVGQRECDELRVTPLTNPVTWNDAALVNLDDIMVSYFVASEYMLRQEQTLVAKSLLTSAQNRMTMIRATYPKRQQPPCIVGGGSTFDRRALRIVPMVVVGGK